MKYFFLLLLCSIGGRSFCQEPKTEIYLDQDGKIQPREWLVNIHKKDEYINYTTVGETEKTITYKITHYDKALVASRFQAEGDYCGNTKKKLTAKEIGKMPFFKDVASIKLTSFKRDRATLLCTIPKTDGKVDLNRMFEVVNLDEAMKEKALDLLVNYDTPPSDYQEVIFCYDPRNAILFFDSADRIIGSVEICFECMKHISDPETLLLGEFCRNKYNILQGFFRSAGVWYGTRVNEE